MSKKPKKTAGDVEFVEVIARLGRGATNREASEMLRELMKRVVATGKAGSLTLTLKVKQIKATEQTVIEDALKVRQPEFDRPVTIGFPDEEGNFLRDDPNQRSLFEEAIEPLTAAVEAVDLPHKTTVVVDLATGEIKE